jgi:hypothetical protein
MAFYAIDVRDQVIQRVNREYHRVDNKLLFLIEAGSAKRTRAKANIASEPVGSGVCSSCRHCHCRVCEEWFVTKTYSDYRTCHCCGALTERVPTSH